MLDLNKLCEVALENTIKRMNNGGNISTDTVKMIKHCATEVVEVMESYVDFVYESDKKSHFESELADVICCVLIIARKEKIDIEKAILDCIERNRKRAEGIGDKK